LRRWYPARIGS